MDDGFIYTVGMSSVRLERHTLYLHFLANTAMIFFKKIQLLAKKIFTGGFEEKFCFFGEGGTEVFLFGCFYHFHLIINFQNYRTADITF